MAALREDASNHEQSEHERIVVRAPEEDEQRQGIQHRKREGHAAASAERSRQYWHSPAESGHADERDDAKRDDGRKDVVSSERDDPSREPFPHWPIGGNGVLPDRIDKCEESTAAKGDRPVFVGVDPA